MAASGCLKLVCFGIMLARKSFTFSLVFRRTHRHMPKKMDYFLWKLQQKQRWMSTNYFLRLVRKIELWLFVFISESFATFFPHFVLRILTVFCRSRLNSFCHPVILERACFEVCQKHLIQLVQFCVLISSCHGNLNFSAFLAFRFFICLHN